MYIANITNEYGNMTPTNCTDKEYNIDTTILSFLFTISCCLSILCLISLMVYTLIKPVFNKKLELYANIYQNFSYKYTND